MPTSLKPSASAIGIFDSGVGGLTVMQQIAALLPHDNIVYFGDTARIPYGDKTPQTIIRYTIENVIFLMEHPIKVLVIACNTASAHAVDKIRNIFKVPVVEVIEAGVEKAVAETKCQGIAVLGTRGTILSGVYQKEIKKRLPDAFIQAIPCPLFVPLVEEQWFSHEATRLIVRDYLQSLNREKVDTVLLGCTHYPLLREIIGQEAGEAIQIVDSATSCAEKVKQVLLLHHCQQACSNNAAPNYQYYVSDGPERFQRLGEAILGRPIESVKLHTGTS